MLNNNLHDLEQLEKIPTRNGYGDGVILAGQEDENVMVLCCDLSDSTRSLKFKETFPERFLEIGVAEQNLAGIGAGLALEGKIPFCSSYAVFNPGRNWDQIRVSVCYNNANVKIIGAHAGISVGPDGATHQALEDISALRALPNLVILAPCDYYESRKATIEAAKHIGPVYIRLARNATPVFTKEDTPFEIGKAQVFKEGKDVTIIGCGPLMYESLTASEELKADGIDVEVINCATIKPLDIETIINSVKKTGAVVTAEEHQIIGGLGGAVAEALCHNYPAPMEFIGMPDSFGESGKPQELLDKYGMSHGAIVTAVKKVLNRK